MTKKLLTKKSLSILNKEYRNILIKCALLNACAYMFMPAVANADTDNIYLHPGSIFAEEYKGAHLDIYGTDTSVSKVTVNNVMVTGAYPIPVSPHDVFIYSFYTNNDHASLNGKNIKAVNVKNGDHSFYVYGVRMNGQYGNAGYNTFNIENSNLDYAIGVSVSGNGVNKDFSHNSLTVKDGSNIGFLYGVYLNGETTADSASYNTVTVEDSKISYFSAVLFEEGGNVGNASNNTVILKNVEQTYSARVATGQTANNNKLIAKDTTLGNFVVVSYGDEEDGEANNNTLDISGNSKVTGSVYIAKAKTVNNNRLTAKDTTFDDGVTVGYGQSSGSEANSNILDVSGGEFKKAVYVASGKTANNNRLTAENTTFNDKVFVGYGDGAGSEASNNTMDVSGGEFKGNVYVADGKKVNNNRLTVKNATFNGALLVAGGSLCFGADEANNNTVDITGGNLRGLLMLPWQTKPIIIN